jgi:hypothetical protein
MDLLSVSCGQVLLRVCYREVRLQSKWPAYILFSCDDLKGVQSSMEAKGYIPKLGTQNTHVLPLVFF